MSVPVPPAPVIARFLNILVLLLTSFLIAFLVGPLVDRLAARGLPRIVAILLLYLIILGGLAHMDLPNLGVCFTYNP